tara:strand:- start:190 stop:381 length:192 start_codon:yes stop_codon:yes gene_type:complete
MKNIGIILIALLLVGCSVPKSPKLSFGKKCAVQGDQVVWSHVWIYGKDTGLNANKETCKLIEK